MGNKKTPNYQSMTSLAAKTIQIFLPDGNPKSLRIAEFTLSDAQIMVIPHAQLDQAFKRQELSKVAVYFLVGESSPGGLPRVYVGEAEVAKTRIKQQNRLKDWWTVALVCTSKTNALTKAHVKYLEWYCHKQALETKRCMVDNSNLPTKPHVSESMEADLLQFFDSIRILTGTLGFSFFDKIQKLQPSQHLICKGKKAKGKGEYTEEGFIVFESSLSNRIEAESAGQYVIDARKSLLENGILEVVDKDTLRFTRDYVFPSPSAAASAVLARRANGWVEWKYANGKTLDEVKRK